MKYTDEWGNKWNISFTLNRDNKGRITLQSWCEEGPYATIMRPIGNGKRIKDTFSEYLDTNNSGHIIAAMKKRGYIEVSETEVGFSGYCMYPLGKLTEKFFEKEMGVKI